MAKRKPRLPTKLRKMRPPGTRTTGKNLGREKVITKPQGRRFLKLGSKPLQTGIGPGEPPEGFVGVWTSKTEWYVYWALCRLTEPNKNPRLPPFAGGSRFTYQKAEKGGRKPGGSVTDFVVLAPIGYIGIRVETERWHIWTTSDQIMKDAYIREHIASTEKTIRVYDQHFIGDPSGDSVMRVMAMALKGVEMPSPIKMGTAQRVRP
jgi:hypothetical protein